MPLHTAIYLLNLARTEVNGRLRERDWKLPIQLHLSTHMRGDAKFSYPDVFWMPRLEELRVDPCLGR